MEEIKEERERGEREGGRKGGRERERENLCITTYVKVVTSQPDI